MGSGVGSWEFRSYKQQSCLPHKEGTGTEERRDKEMKHTRNQREREHTVPDKDVRQDPTSSEQFRDFLWAVSARNKIRVHTASAYAHQHGPAKAILLRCTFCVGNSRLSGSGTHLYSRLCFRNRRSLEREQGVPRHRTLGPALCGTIRGRRHSLSLHRVCCCDIQHRRFRCGGRRPGAKTHAVTLDACRSHLPA